MSNTGTCENVYGADETVYCDWDPVNRMISIYDFAISMTQTPANFTFKLSSITNPSEPITTSSF